MENLYEITASEKALLVLKHMSTLLKQNDNNLLHEILLADIEVLKSDIEGLQYDIEGLQSDLSEANA